MISILETVLPVLAMMFLGMFCKKKQFLTKSCIDGLKFLVVNVMLPLAVFHGLATASYGKEMIVSVSVMFLVMGATFLLGFVCRPLVDKPQNKYLPFLTSVYEGGMIAYPLYTGLVGMENLSVIAMIDIAGLLFCFGIFINVLTQMEDHTPINVKSILCNTLKNPAFIATLFGIVAGLTGVINLLLDTPAGNVYLSIKNMMVAAMSPMILMVVGYEAELSKRLLLPCLKSMAIRAVLQGIFACIVLGVLHILIGKNELMDIAILVYMSAPGSLGIQSFVKDEDGCKYLASTNSLYMMLTIIVYAMLSFVYR